MLSDPSPTGPSALAEPAARLRTVAVVASHDLLRAGLIALLGSAPELTVVGSAADVPGARRCLLEHHPDVLVLAVPRALAGGGTLVRELRALGDGLPLVVVGTDRGEAYTSVARAAGATYVPLDDPAAVLARVTAAAKHL